MNTHEQIKISTPTVMNIYLCNKLNSLSNLPLNKRGLREGVEPNDKN